MFCHYIPNYKYVTYLTLKPKYSLREKAPKKNTQHPPTKKKMIYKCPMKIVLKKGATIAVTTLYTCHFKVMLYS